MDVQQNSTKLTPQQEKFINFVASGQVNLDNKRQSYEEFAASLSVDRSTLYNWRRTIPEFWKLVAERSSYTAERRVPAIMNAMYAKALKGDVQAAKLVLNQAGYLKAPPRIEEERVEMEMDLYSLSPRDLMARALGVDELPGPEAF